MRKMKNAEFRMNKMRNSTLGVATWVSCLSVALSMTAWVWYLRAVNPSPSYAIALISCVCATCLVGAAAASRNDRRLMPFAFFVAITAVFHFGILVVHLVADDVVGAVGRTLLWYRRETIVIDAYFAALVFLVGLTTAAFVSGFLRSPAATEDRYQQVNLRDSSRERVAVVIQAIFVMAWIAVLVFSLGVTNYNEYNVVVRGDSVSILAAVVPWLYLAIAACFFFSAAWSNDYRPALAVFLVWSAVAFPIGLRGEVLFPLAMVLPVLHVQGRIRLRWLPMLAGSYVLLLASYFVRLFRNESDLDQAWAGASGLLGLAELGGSLRPVFEVRRWLSTGLDSFRFGETYYAPFERTFALIFPFMNRVPASMDDRLMNVQIVRKTGGGNYGFSIAAEAFINFGYIGCFLIGLSVGLFLVYYGRAVASGRVGIAASAALYALYYHIRQSFVGAYGSFIVFLIMGVILAVILYGREGVPGRTLQGRTSWF